MNAPARRPPVGPETERLRRIDRSRSHPSGHENTPRRRRGGAGARASAKRDAEFAREVLPYQRELYAAALRYTKEPAGAEDLVQETLLRALANWDRFQLGSNCRAWLYRILTNSFINKHRRKKRHQRFAHERGDDGVIALYGAEKRRHHQPDEPMLHAALSDEVAAALDELSEDYRRVVELADLEGIRYKDIAKRLGIPIGTVMSRLFRARRQLEETLREFARECYGIRRAA